MNGTGAIDFGNPDYMIAVGPVIDPSASLDELAWIEPDGTVQGTFDITVPADGRVIVAATIDDASMVRIWLQGVRVVEYPTSVSLEGGMLAALGARSGADGALSDFCGCAVHECECPVLYHDRDGSADARDRKHDVV